MSQHDDDIQNSLAPPKAGLPVVQAFVLRYMIFPAYCLTTSWEKAIAAFQAEGQKVIALVEPLSAEQLQRRVLVKAPMGIEDSSRYWSASMVLEHLIEVGSRIAVGIVELTHASTVTVKADIADVKPKGGKGSQIVQDFRQFLGIIPGSCRRTSATRTASPGTLIPGSVNSTLTNGSAWEPFTSRSIGSRWNGLLLG